jgi:RecB family endonuclease NucS
MVGVDIAMNRIRVEQSFVLYAQCSVCYDGRAKSTLIPGNYLITHKNDGTLKIDGGALCTPLNYQPPGAIMYKQGNILISLRKGEKITIEVDKVYYYQELKEWSTNKIDISKTEAQLREKIAANIDDILGIKSVEVFQEFKTPVGDIDVLAIDIYDTYHIVEVKRGKASLATCSQLERYCFYFIDIMKNVRDYIASPDITDNALRHAGENYQTYLKVEHSI